MLDIRHTENGDIDLGTGDLFLDEPTEQHQRDLLICGQGHVKESPMVGVDSVKHLLDHDEPDYLRRVRIEFAKDGMKVKSVAMEDAELIIDASYENNNG